MKISTSKPNRPFNPKFFISKLLISLFTSISNMLKFQFSLSANNSSFSGQKFWSHFLLSFFSFSPLIFLYIFSHTLQLPFKKSCQPYIQTTSSFQSLFIASPAVYNSSPGTAIHCSSLLTGLPYFCPGPSNSLFLTEQPECFLLKS